MIRTASISQMKQNTMTPPKKPRAFRFPFPIAHILFGGVIAVGCDRGADRSINEETKAPASATIERVTAGPPVKKTLRLFTDQPGRVEAFEETPVLSKIPGYVKSIHFDIGDKVKKGETVIELYAPEYRDQVEQKKGLMEQAQAQVKQAEAGLLAAQASLNSSKAIIAQAEATNDRTEAEYARWESENSRIQQLVSKGSVTPKLADETASKLQAAQAAKDEAIATIDSTKAREREADANMSKAQADLDAAHAKLKTAVADVHQAETMLNYTALTSSFDGYVIRRHVDLGHYVQPANSNSAQPLMTIVNADKVRVFVSIPESEAIWVDAGFEDLTKGDLATISFGTAMNRTIEARVTRTSRQLDPQSRSLTTEIDLENGDLRLLPGSYATAKILLEERPDVLTLPISAIVKTGNGTACCTIVGGKVQYRSIELGLRVGDDVQITAGLDGSETVVLVRASSLKIDQPVEVIANTKK